MATLVHYDFSLKLLYNILLGLALPLVVALVVADIAHACGIPFLKPALAASVVVCAFSVFKTLLAYLNDEGKVPTLWASSLLMSSLICVTTPFFL